MRSVEGEICPEMGSPRLDYDLTVPPVACRSGMRHTAIGSRDDPTGHILHPRKTWPVHSYTVNFT